MKYDAVIFDKDGVLIDSMSDGYQWANELRANYYRELGKDVTAEKAEELVRLRSPEQLEEFIDTTGVGLEHIRKAERKIVKRKMEKIRQGEIQLFDSVPRILAGLEVPKSVVSNAPMMATEFTLKHFEIEHHFETVESPSLNDLEEYVQIRKPSKHMIEKVMKGMGAEKPLMVGDSSDDIKAAKNAGIDSCLVNPRKAYEVEPDYRFDNLGGIRKILDLT